MKYIGNSMVLIAVGCLLTGYATTTIYKFSTK